MLILGRRIDEKIVLTPENGAPITIMVVAVSDGCVRIGIDAPKSVAIHRHEILDNVPAKQKHSYCPAASKVRK